ncbi:hypothetical protein Hanom_Chr04g00301951 [Helianthus anomalus]
MGSLRIVCIVSRRLSYRGLERCLVFCCLSVNLYCGRGMTFPSINKSPTNKQILPEMTFDNNNE